MPNIRRKKIKHAKYGLLVCIIEGLFLTTFGRGPRHQGSSHKVRGRSWQSVEMLLLKGIEMVADALLKLLVLVIHAGAWC
jgi:hypothetical protein